MAAEGDDRDRGPALLGARRRRLRRHRARGLDRRHRRQGRSRAARRSRSSSSANLYTGQERTFKRKIKEACLAIKLASKWPKPKILNEYLNTVYYGNHAYGVEAASQTYFSKHARQLTLLQSALLAGLPQAPSVYDPFHNPRGGARPPQRGAARDASTITTSRRRSTVRRSRTSSLGLKPGRIYTRIKQPYFFSYVIDELERQYGTNTVREGGLKVYTTIDPRLQRLANKAIRDVLPYKTDPAARSSRSSRAPVRSAR